MEEIVKLYNEHLGAAFPDRRGDEILGIDLVMIDSYTAGTIDSYISSRGRLPRDKVKILYRCYSDLSTVVNELDGADRQYFARLQNIAGLIIEKIKEQTDKG